MSRPVVTDRKVWICPGSGCARVVVTRDTLCDQCAEDRRRRMRENCDKGGGNELPWKGVIKRSHRRKENV